MPWKMKRLHLIFVTLILWGDTSGFPVWNRTSVVDWQAGLSNTPWNQTVQLSTRVQPDELLSRGGGNANVKGGRFSSVPLTSSQTTGASLVYARPSSGSYVTSMGPSIPSSSQSAVLTNWASYQPSTATQVSAGPSATDQSMGSVNPSQTSGRYTVLQGRLSPSPSQMSASQSSNQPSTGTQFEEGQSVSTAPAQTSGASLVSQPPSSGGYVTSMGPGIPSSSQSAVLANQASYQPNTATRVSAGPSAVAQFSGVSYPRQTVLQSQWSPSSSQSSGIQTRVSNQPSYTRLVSTGQATFPQLQSSNVSTLPELQASSRYPLQSQRIPSVQSEVGTTQIFGSQIQSAYQPNAPPQISAGQSLTSQAPFSSRSGSSESVKWYTIMQPQIAPPSFQSVGTANQIPGFQTQLSNQPSSASPVLAGQSTIAQSLGTSYPSLTSARYAVLRGRLSQSPSQASASQASNQPSTGTQFAAGQAVSSVQAQTSGASLVYPDPSSGSYFTSMGLGVPSSSQSAVLTNRASYQPSTATHASAGPSATDQSMGSVNPSQTSGRYTVLQGWLSPSPSQASASQASNQPSTGTQFAAGQSVSSVQAQTSGASLVYPDASSGSYFTSMGLGVPSSSQSAVLTNQAPYQPSTETQVSVGPSATAQFMGSVYPPHTSGRYTVLQGQLSPSASQASNQPSTGTQFAAGQSVSSVQAQTSGASLVYPDPSSGSYFTSMGLGTPSSSQSAVLINQALFQPSTATQVSVGPSATAQFMGSVYPPQTSGSFTVLQGQLSPSASQASNQPSTGTRFTAGQSVSTAPAQSSGASLVYPGPSSGSYLSSLGLGTPSSSQSAVLTNQAPYQPSTATQVSVGPSATAQFMGSVYPPQTSGRYTVLQGQLGPSPLELPVSQASNQQSTGTPFAAGQSVSIAPAQSSGVSVLNQSLSSGRYLTPLGPSFPIAPQSAAATNQTYGSQTPTYQLIRTSILPGQLMSMIGSQKVLLPNSNV